MCSNSVNTKARHFLGIIIFKIYNPQYQSIKDYVFASAINDN